MDFARKYASKRLNNLSIPNRKDADLKKQILCPYNVLFSQQANASFSQDSSMM